MKAIYDSVWHNPVLFWAAGLLFFALLARRLAPLHGFLLLFGVEIVADAYLTGGLTPLAQGTTAATLASVLFVILGDLRYFWLLERVAQGASFTAASVVGRAVAMSLVVPVVAFVVPRALPSLFTELRHTFLFYELLLLAASLLLLATRVRQVAATGPAWAHRYVLGLTRFEAAQYALWAVADVVILLGVDAGHGLRLVPNAMYYALFMPFALLTAPDEARG